MEPFMNRRYNIASIGAIYRKSLEMFASRLEDLDGNPIDLDAIDVHQRFYVIFPSGTGLTRTSGIRMQ